MLRSDTLMLDNTLIPAYQERVTSLTFNTDEHTSEHMDSDERSDDDDDDEESLVMTGVCRGAGKHVINICISPSLNPPTPAHYVDFLINT